MTSLFDPWAKVRAQRTRLKSLFENPVEEEKEEDKSPVDYWQGGDQGGGRGGNATDAARAGGRDHRSFSGFGEFFNDPQVRRDGWALMDIITGPSAMRGGYNAITGDDPVTAGLRSAEAAYQASQMNTRGDPMLEAAMAEQNEALGAQAAAEAQAQAAAAEMNLDTGVGASPYAKGGKVKKAPKRSLFADVDPPGPDDTIIAAKSGERVLNDEQWARLSPEARKEIEAVFKATGARK